MIKPAWIAAGGLTLLVATIIAAAAPPPPPAAPDPWCRLDDAGTAEQQRRETHRPPEELECSDVPGGVSLQPEIGLPLPCQRRLMMRRVALRVSHLLDDQEIFLGTPEENASPSTLMLSGPHRAYISGTLGSAAAAERYYYIGKYEVSDLQMQMFRAGLFSPNAKESGCAAIRTAALAIPGTRVPPATDVSWFEAVAFADALTQYLVALDRRRITANQAPLALPWIGALPGFLRLPTEDEWEFAARGGRATEGEWSHRLPPDANNQEPEDVEQIASIYSPNNPPEGGRLVYPIGRKQPNSLGLFDMLGNAEEMTLNLFYPVRPDGRLAGLPGGYVVRGGNAQDRASDLSVSIRREKPFYRDDGQTTATTTGFRLVLSGPIKAPRRLPNGDTAASNPDFDRELEVSWNLLSKAAGAGAEERQTAATKLIDLQNRLQQSRQEAEQINRQLQDAQAEAARQAAAQQQRQIAAMEAAQESNRLAEAKLKIELEKEDLTAQEVTSRLYEAKAENARMAETLRLQQAAVADAERRARQEGAQQIATMDAALHQRLDDLEQANHEVDGIRAELVRSNTAINTRDRRIRLQLIEGQINLGLEYNNIWRRMTAAPEIIRSLHDQLASNRNEDGSALTLVQRKYKEDQFKIADMNIGRLRYTNGVNFQRYVDGMSQLAREPKLGMAEALQTISTNDGRREDFDYERVLTTVKRHLSQAQDSGGAIAANRQQEWRLDLERRLIEP